MNILDENIRADQRGLLQSWGIPVRQIGRFIVVVNQKAKVGVSLSHDLKILLKS